MTRRGKKRVSSGVPYLDRVLGGLFIGDNVLWHDEAGSLAFVFGYNLLAESVRRQRPVIYVSFDRSPKNLLDMLGPLAETQYLTVLDCFTNGKGDGSQIFAQFYEKAGAEWPYRIVRVHVPGDPEQVAEAFYGLHQSMSGEVRFIFESLTGMQDLWDGEEPVMRFYAQACPRLYELDTVAYWVLEKDLHSRHFMAYINQIAQVAIDLTKHRGASSLSVHKAEKRNLNNLNTAHMFKTEGMTPEFREEQGVFPERALGRRIKAFRTGQGLSQKELAGLAGLTPSTVSQVESSTTLPSLPALFKLAEVLGVDVGSFFSQDIGAGSPVVLRPETARSVESKDLARQGVAIASLAPLDSEARVEPYLVEMEPEAFLASHFFQHKGEEFGYVLVGRLELAVGSLEYAAEAGDAIQLRADMPSRWRNPGDETARLLWLKIN
jgi:transcriptional regulator with XRE-family HTH domain